MCDTFVALGNSTSDGSVILGKNSDREPNEAHEIKVLPAADYSKGTRVQCTYISIPQVEHTYAVLLAKPFWIWGAEMGVNEHGVAIGNEAIFTKVPYETGKGLIGMDLLRLALERSKTAWEALYTITHLLEEYGQGGNCGFTHPFFYHNSFLLADPSEAWVLETAGRQWVAEKVKDVRSISNRATIGKTWDLASDDLVTFALDQGWCKNRKEFDFARCYSDFTYTTFSAARSRQVCTTSLLRQHQGQVTVRSAMQFLRSHGLNTDPASLRLDQSLLGATVCMHAGAGPARGSQSVGSLVAHLAPDLVTSWVTATSAPCTGVFKPVWIDAGYPLQEPELSGAFDLHCLWWRHERLHRTVLRNYAARLTAYAPERNAMEERFLQEGNSIGSSVQERCAFTARCFKEADEASERWVKLARAVPANKRLLFYYNNAWKGFSAQAGMDLATG